MCARTAGLLALICVTAGAQAELSYQRIVGVGDEFPGGGTYYSMSSRFGIENDTLYFFGRPSSSARYSLITQPVDGDPTVLADNSMTIPGGTGTFYNMTSFAPSVSNGYVAFHNKTSGNSEHGLYMCDPSGNLSVIVDRNTPMPDFESNFGSFSGPVLVDGDVYFRATSLTSGQDGYYHASNGQFTAIANNSTIIPTTGTLLSTKSDCNCDGTRFCFEGGDEFEYTGIFSTIDDGQTLEVHADTLTSMPNYTAWTFDAMSDPCTDNGIVVWRAQSAKDGEHDDFRMQGIYADLGDELVSLVDLYTPNPGGGNFRKIDALKAYEDGYVLFTGEHDRTDTGDEDGVYYVAPDGSVHLVIEEAQTVDGKVIEDLLNASLSGQTAVVSVGFEDGSKAVYAVTIPEPTSLLLLATGAAVAALRRR
jgi:hypothetical protein